MDKDREKLTPEEQLLKIIENPEQAASKVKLKKKFPLRIPSFEKLRGLLSFAGGNFKKSFAKAPVLRIKPDLKFTNRVLVGVCAALVLFLVVNLAVFRKDPEQLFASAGEIPSGALALGVLEEPKMVSFYKEPAVRRNIFGPVEKAAPEAPAAASDGQPSEQSGPAERSIDVVTKGFKLVGISWGMDPQAMIEDSATNRTYFVRPGQYIEKVQIRGVFKDRVVVSYEEQEKELY